MQESDAVPKRIGAMEMDSGEVRVFLKEIVGKESVIQRWLILLLVDPPTEASAKFGVHKSVVPFCKEFAPPDIGVMNSDDRCLGKMRSNPIKGFQVMGKVVRCIDETEVYLPILNIVW